jgi:hypothetical protein
MTEFIRDITGCKHIGFFITEPRTSIIGVINEHTGEYVPPEEVSKINKSWKDDGYYSRTNIGYDMYYYVKSENMNAKDEDYELDSDMTSKKIAKVFSDNQESKRKHRILVSKFAQDIAA